MKSPDPSAVTLRLLVLLLMGGCALGPGHSHVTIRNLTGETVRSIAVTADDKTVKFSDVEPRGIRQATFRIWADSNYEARATLANGKELSIIDEHYLTNGIDTNDVIELLPSAIRVKVNYQSISSVPEVGNKSGGRSW